MGAVSYVVDGLRELPGRKSMILFSENPNVVRQRQKEPVRDGQRGVGHAAAPGGCGESLRGRYTIDPRGLQFLGLTAADDAHEAKGTGLCRGTAFGRNDPVTMHPEGEMDREQFVEEKANRRAGVRQAEAGPFAQKPCGATWNHVSMGKNSIVFTTRLAGLVYLSSLLSFAGTWSGTLVDSKCFYSEERNVNPTDTMTFVDRDMNQEIRFCSPSTRTRSFVVVQHDGLSFRLDSAGDAKAAELVRNTGKKSRFFVVITGESGKDTIRVDSIATAR